ncbi:hypothetical protein B0H14DRAFT_2625508 [Mycena olivaceomarginata]|nr:hypothetical protein B0H14DRAFT_2625508 [Mycena olivaceomarginata]
MIRRWFVSSEAPHNSRRAELNQVSGFVLEFWIWVCSKGRLPLRSEEHGHPCLAECPTHIRQAFEGSLKINVERQLDIMCNCSCGLDQSRIGAVLDGSMRNPSEMRGVGLFRSLIGRRGSTVGGIQILQCMRDWNGLDCGGDAPKSKKDLNRGSGSGGLDGGGGGLDCGGEKNTERCLEWEINRHHSQEYLQGVYGESEARQADDDPSDGMMDEAVPNRSSESWRRSGKLDPWDAVIRRGERRIFSRSCEKDVDDGDETCMRCEDIATSAHFQTVQHHILNPPKAKTNLAYYSTNGLVKKVREGQRSVRALRLVRINDGKKIASRTRALALHKQWVAAVASGKVLRANSAFFVKTKQLNTRLPELGVAHIAHLRSNLVDRTSNAAKPSYFRLPFDSALFNRASLADRVIIEERSEECGKQTEVQEALRNHNNRGRLSFLGHLDARSLEAAGLARSDQAEAEAGSG